MSTVVRIDFKNQSNESNISHRGIAGVMRYDPHIPRCFEGLKYNLLQGRPSILRLHSGSNYPTGEYRHQIDKEGQAILIVGYDDDEKAFAVIDPYQRSSERPTITWLPYDQLALQNVDASMANDMSSVGLDIQMALTDDSKLQATVGLPRVYGTLMDHDCFTLEDISVEMVLKYDGKTETHQQIAHDKCLIGSAAVFTIDLPHIKSGTLEVVVNAEAILHGNRPYEYRDTIGADLRHSFVLSNEEDNAESIRQIVNG